MAFQHGVSDYDLSDRGRESYEVGFELPKTMQIRDAEIFGLSHTTSMRKSLIKAVEAVVASGRGFGMYATGDGKLALATIPLGDGTTLESRAHEYVSLRQGVKMTEVEALHWWLMRTSACYVEQPTMRHSADFGSTKSREKDVRTLSLGIVEDWMRNEVLRPALIKRLQEVDYQYPTSADTGKLTLPFVKLSSDRGGTRKVVAPRSNLEVDTKKLSIVPLYAYEAMVNYIYQKALTSVVRVKYRRTSGEERQMDITFDRSRIEEVYGKDTADAVLSESYKGDFFSETSILRGYVRIPSIGESRFDGIGRSLNFATVFSIEYDVEPDLTYVNMNVPIALGEFQKGVEDLAFSGRSDQLMLMVDMLKQEGIADVGVVGAMESLNNWSERLDMIQGTNFRRKLSLFMLVNSVWFPKYTGANHVDVGSEGGTMTAWRESGSVGLL